MSKGKGGPHYIPEFDPDNPKSPKGFAGKWTMHYVYLLVTNAAFIVISANFGPDWLTITLIIIEILLVSPFVAFVGFS